VDKGGLVDLPEPVLAEDLGLGRGRLAVTNQPTPMRSRSSQPHSDGGWRLTPAVRWPLALTAAAKNSW
jgi:hypothetical protein